MEVLASDAVTPQGNDHSHGCLHPAALDTQRGDKKLQEVGRGPCFVASSRTAPFPSGEASS